MTDPEILAALQAGSSESLVAAYGDSLFRYCWFLLRSRDAAETAVRDTFVVAAAYADRLRDPEWFRPWLYALARTECHRCPPVPPGAADEPPARPSQQDADSRVVAWNAVTSLPPLAGEALELAVRHQLPAAGIALVLGVPDAESRLETAREELSQSLAAHLIVRRTGFDCAGLTAALRGWAGVMTTEIRDRVLGHAAGCASCDRHRPHGVSAARVFGLLPDPRPAAGTRDVVLARLTDPRHSGYRGFVAGRAAGSAPIAALAASDLTATAPLALAAGPAADAGPARSGRRTAADRRVPVTRGRLIAGLLAASVAVAAGALLVLAGFPRAQVLTPSASGTTSSLGAVSPGSSSGARARIGAVGAEPAGERGSASAAPPLVVAFPGSIGQALYLSASQQASPSRTGRQRQRPPAPPPSTGAASSAPSSSSAAPSSPPSSSSSASSSSSPSPSGSGSPAPGTSSPSATGSAS